jgi:pilus assembly protein CpaD
MLAACAPAVGTFQPVEAPKELRVEVARYTHSVRFQAGSATLSVSERERLAAFLDAVGLPPGESVATLSMPGDALAERRRTQLVQELGRRGLGLSTAPTAAGTVADRLSLGDEVVVYAERYVAKLPPCPNWSKPTGVDYGNTVGSNFGCATASNLGLMVANPRDLVIGRDPGPANIDRQVRLEQLFRERTPQTIWCEKGNSCNDGPKLKLSEPKKSDDAKPQSKDVKE